MRNVERDEADEIVKIMILHKVVSVSCCRLPTFYCSQSGLPSPSFPVPNAFGKPEPPKKSDSKKRHYATVKSSKSSGGPNDFDWPTTTGVPTPYQILHLSPSAPYTKHCFYRLVKIYHPDRSKCQNDDRYDHIHRLPGSVKIERYRLIVAAHEILSDPNRRVAYDRYGSGWNGRLDESVFTWPERKSEETTWSGFDTNDSPFQNATWEDWERWYNRHHRPRPVYTSNGGFLSFVILALLAGGVAQGMQVDRHTEFYSKQADVKHKRANQALKQHLEGNGRSGHINDRVQDFLRARDESLHGLGEEAKRRRLAEPAEYTSEGFQERNS